MALRITAFGWAYLLGEALAVLTMAMVSLLGSRRSITATYWLQRVWLDWNFDMLRIAFSLKFRVDGTDQIAPAPFLLLSRHASLIDTMLPGRYVVRPHGYRLRYILKKELLVDPALDIGGNRLPNYFIDRKGSASQELEGVRNLAADLGGRDAVLIYPEGTRYTESKRVKYVAGITWRGGTGSDIVGGYRRVLPPRPGGTLALLEASQADVVVLAHRGLEGFASVADTWDGGLVGSTVYVRFWRIPRSRIPADRDERVKWLYRTWADVDRWITTDP
jgi:1-acyl-sn-glycerol-3-phosphate acyltransferase